MVTHVCVLVLVLTQLCICAAFIGHSFYVHKFARTKPLLSSQRPALLSAPSTEEVEYYFNPHACYLGIDYGIKLCGAAAIQMDTADAFQAVRNHGNLTQLSLDILQETARAKPSAYIIGWPLDWDGGYQNLQAQRCLNFARVFAGVVEKVRGPRIPTFLYDERYTTDLSIAQFKTKRGALDGNAAYHIVHRWIADEGEGSALVKPVLHPSPSLEIVDPEDEEWQAPRELRKFRRPRDNFIGKRRIIQAAKTPSFGHYSAPDP